MEGGPGINNRTIYIPNPIVLLKADNTPDITPLFPSSGLPEGNRVLSLKYDAATDTVSYTCGTTFALDKADPSNTAGSKWQVNTSFAWYHPDDDYSNKTKYPRILQDF